MIIRFIAIACGLIAVGSGVSMVVFRFAHPELTETQLFLACPLWAVGGALIGGIVCGVACNCIRDEDL